MKRLFLAALVGSTALAPATLMAQTGQTQNQQQQMQAQTGQQSGQMQEARVTAAQMRGQPLTGANGAEIGTVSDVLMGRSGESYAVVEVNGGEQRLLPTGAIVLREGRLHVREMTRRDVEELTAAADREEGEFEPAGTDEVLVLAMEGEPSEMQRQQAARQQPDQQQAGEQDRMARADGTRADGAEIVLQRTAPRLMIEQPEVEVTVDQAEPNVTVRQQNPQIIVRQAPPTITIEQPQPEIIVRMPEPEVEVSMGQPQVDVQQQQPRVRVEQPEQQAAVQVERSPAQVRLSGDANQAQVQVEPGRPDVRFERTGEPQVVLREQEGQPTVRYERMRQDDQQQAAQRQPAQQESMGEQDQARGILIEPEGEVEATGALDAEMRAVAIEELEGETVYNFRGEELGDVERIVITVDEEFLVVISSGGFLGLGEDTIALPLQRISMQGDRLMVRGVTEADIEAMQDYEDRYPDTRDVGPGEQVELGMRQ